MKKSFYVIFILSCVCYRPTFMMESGEWIPVIPLFTAAISTLVVAHPELAGALENNAFKASAKLMPMHEFPHQPKQQYRVKKTQQPNKLSKRQFSQYHK